MEEQLEQLFMILDKHMELYTDCFSPDHDLYHHKRARDLGLYIQEREGGDRLVIHDLHRFMSVDREQYVSPKESLGEAKIILDECRMPLDKQKMILYCIEHHENYSFSKKGNQVTDINTLIVQDADNLDALGAIGVSRAFSYAGAHKMALWNPDLVQEKATYDEHDAAEPSAIHHFYDKLLKLKDNMNTETAHKLAEDRHTFMRSFLIQFRKEWYLKTNRL